MLTGTARTLVESFPNDFVARLGGDEFLVARLGECSVEQLEKEAGNSLQSSMPGSRRPGRCPPCPPA